MSISTKNIEKVNMEITPPASKSVEVVEVLTKKAFGNG